MSRLHTHLPRKSRFKHCQSEESPIGDFLKPGAGSTESFGVKILCYKQQPINNVEHYFCCHFVFGYLALACANFQRLASSPTLLVLPVTCTRYVASEWFVQLCRKDKQTQPPPPDAQPGKEPQKKIGTSLRIETHAPGADGDDERVIYCKQLTRRCSKLRVHHL